MLFSENPAAFGEPLEAFFPKSVVPKWMDAESALEQLSKHENPRYAKTAELLLKVCRFYHETEAVWDRALFTSELIVQYYSDRLEKVSDRVKVLLFNERMHLLSEVETSLESLDTNMAVRREILLPVVETRASRMLLVQFRPEGSPAPTADEKMAWYHLSECARIFKVRLMDSLIIGDNAYHSVGNGWHYCPDHPDPFPPVNYR